MMVLMQAGTSGQGRPACIRGIMCLLASRRLPRGFSPGKPRPAQVRAGHLLLESARLARADCPRRGGFTRHEMRAHGVFPAMGTPPRFCLECGCRACANPTSDPVCRLLPSLVQVLLVVGPPSWARLVVCRGDQQRTVDHLPPYPAPADTAQGRGKERSRGRWGPRVSASSLGFQDVILLLWEEQDLSRYPSCRPRGFRT